MNDGLKKRSKWMLPVGVIAIAYGLAAVIRNAGPEVEIVIPEPQPLVVRTMTVEPESAQLTISSQGEVNAEYMIDFVSELQGSIKRVSPSFVSGGYFKAGDVLLELDPTDYELAKIRAEARVAEETEALEIEKSESALAAKGLFPLREAMVASAEARLRSARAELAQAETDLQRTKIRVPFDGRVLFTQVDLGQNISKGQTLGRIYSTGIAEIRLPLTDQQLSFLDLPFGARPTDELPGAEVTLQAVVGGKLAEWQGRLHRMEGAIDPENRVWYAVARVEDPYGLNRAEQSVPLAVGLFVQAQITGRAVDNVFRIPRQALRNETGVLIVDQDNRLRLRQVEVLRTDFESAVISSGLTAGERICISPVEAFVEGLLVEVVPDSIQSSKLARSSGS